MSYLKRITEGKESVHETARAADERIAELEKQLAEERLKTDELADFAIWMTGCGYDFCQHGYFIKQREKLLKQPNNHFPDIRKKVKL